MKILVASGFITLEEYFMYWFRLRHSIPEKALADLFYVSVGSVNAILKTWCILINSVFMKLPIYPTTEEFNSVCPEKVKKMFPRCIAIYDCTEFYTQMPSKLDLQGCVVRILSSSHRQSSDWNNFMGVRLFLLKIVPRRNFRSRNFS